MVFEPEVVYVTVKETAGSSFPWASLITAIATLVAVYLTGNAAHRKKLAYDVVCKKSELYVELLSRVARYNKCVIDFYASYPKKNREVESMQKQAEKLANQSDQLLNEATLLQIDVEEAKNKGDIARLERITEESKRVSNEASVVKEESTVILQNLEQKEKEQNQFRQNFKAESEKYKAFFNERQYDLIVYASNSVARIKKRLDKHLLGISEEPQRLDSRIWDKKIKKYERDYKKMKKQIRKELGVNLF